MFVPPLKQHVQNSKHTKWRASRFFPHDTVEYLRGSALSDEMGFFHTCDILTVTVKFFFCSMTTFDSLPVLRWLASAYDSIFRTRLFSTFTTQVTLLLLHCFSVLPYQWLFPTLDLYLTTFAPTVVYHLNQRLTCL